jgi:hypothetical protein
LAEAYTLSGLIDIIKRHRPDYHSSFSDLLTHIEGLLLPGVVETSGTYL